MADAASQDEHASTRRLEGSTSSKSWLGGTRPNRIVGRVVPSILLAYVALSWRLVAVEVGYKHLCLTRGRYKLSGLWLVPAHAVFVCAVRSYLTIFLAHSKGAAPGPLSRLLGAHLIDLRKEPRLGAKWRREMQECDEKGELLRCYRDKCNGSWKPPRTRHCGDCGTCRVALDHHCPWFDADVALPSTSKPFLLFLAEVVVLLNWIYLPLLPTAYSHLRKIWAWACSSEEMRRNWWEWRGSWLGGPAWRWGVGWLRAARSYVASVEDREASRSSVFAVPGRTVPVLSGLGLLLISIASALLISTLRNLARGETTIDVERRKLLARAQANATRATPAGDTAPESTALTSSPKFNATQYFWVPTGSTEESEEGIVVALLPDERPYDLGTRENLKLAMGMEPYAAEKLAAVWPLNPVVEARLRATAADLARKTT